MPPASKRSTKAARNAGTKRRTPLRARLASFAAAARPWLAGAAIAGCVLGAALGAGAVRRAAADELIERHADAGAVFTWPALDAADPTKGTWLPETYRHRLQTLAADTIARDKDPFSPTALRRLGERLAASGWFAEPPSLRRRADGHIEVTASWRQPAAVVRSKGRDHLVSWRAMPMPVSYREGEASLPVIVGSDAHPPLEAGSDWYARPWPDDRIEPALAVLLELRRAGLDGEVIGLDVSGLRARDGMLELVTSAGARVVWGSPPGLFRPGENATEEKIRRLAELRARFGSIDAGQPAVSVWGPETTVERRPAP